VFSASPVSAASQAAGRNLTRTEWAERVGGIEVTVCQMVARPSDIYPRNVRLTIQQLRGDRPDGLADLDEMHAHGIEDQPVVELAATEVLADCTNGSQDVLEKLIIAPAHNGIASANT